MRSYPRNSPQAAARIVALALLADGHLGGRELAMLERHEAHARLGLTRAEFQEVLRHLAEDQLATGTGHWSGTSRIEEAVLSLVLAEVEAPELRQTVLALCLAVTQADNHFSDGELVVLATAIRRWRLEPAAAGPRGLG